MLGLWKVVCDHQFHLVAAALPVEEQNMLRGMYFRDLMISGPGRELCNRLVQTVVDMYLKDNASTDAISHRLREICPTLYASEDAISSKAHEMLIAARASNVDSSERSRLMRDAVGMCKDIAGRINLDVLVSHLTAVHYYDGAVEIALAAAAKRDPQGLGLHYYKNGEPVDDHQGLQAKKHHYIFRLSFMLSSLRFFSFSRRSCLACPATSTSLRCFVGCWTPPARTRCRPAFPAALALLLRRTPTPSLRERPESTPKR